LSLQPLQTQRQNLPRFLRLHPQPCRCILDFLTGPLKQSRVNQICCQRVKRTQPIPLLFILGALWQIFAKQRLFEQITHGSADFGASIGSKGAPPKPPFIGCLRQCVGAGGKEVIKGQSLCPTAGCLQHH